MAELLFQSKQEKLADGSLIIITKILGAIDGTTVRQFEDKLIGFFNQGVKNLILIFSDVKYINSTGMGLLVKLADKFQEGGGDIKLVGVPEKVIALFDMLGLLSLFKIYETEEDAIDSIGQAKPAASSAAPVKQPEPPKAPAEPARATTAGKKPAPAPAPAAPAPAATARPQTAQAAPAPARVPAAPAPAKVAAPAESEEVGLGVAGINISDDESGNAQHEEPAKPVSWPFDSNCAHCSGALQFAAKGNYQCPRCHSYISIDEFGKQVVQAAVSSKLVEVKCPCTNNYIAAAKALLSGLAVQVGFSQVFCDEIGSALEDAIGIAIEKSANPAETFQILAIADSSEMVVGIKSLNAFLAQGAPKDRRLPLIAKKVDRLEVFPLPNRGQLLKITKKKK
jgi:anti-anti-sigma factor